MGRIDGAGSRKPDLLCQARSNAIPLGRTLGVLDLEQLAGIVESPAVERAGVSRLVGPLVTAQHGAAMAACVDESIQFVVLVAGDEDRLPPHVGRVVVVLVGDLAFM